MFKKKELYKSVILLLIKQEAARLHRPAHGCLAVVLPFRN